MNPPQTVDAVLGLGRRSRLPLLILRSARKHGDAIVMDTFSLDQDLAGHWKSVRPISMTPGFLP